MSRACVVRDLGRMSYGEALAIQLELANERKQGLGADHLLFVEHPHVVTIGRNGSESNILAPMATLEQLGVEVFETDRGGDVTYHGPGQIVAYPVMDLREWKRDVGLFVRGIEQTLIDALSDFGIEARRIARLTGVWVGEDEGMPARSEAVIARPEVVTARPEVVTARPEVVTARPEAVTARPEAVTARPEVVTARPEAVTARPEAVTAKIGAIGVHLSRWVSTHGWALNVKTDLRYFQYIVPCGLTKPVTSMEALGVRADVEDVKAALAGRFGKIFDFEMQAEPALTGRL